MYHLKLMKGMSFTGIVEATKDKPDVFTEDKATAESAVATGYFELVKQEEQEDDGATTQKEGKTLDEMTVSELETLASYHDVSLKGLSKKADMISKLKEELGEEKTDGIVEYGSPTIVQLQG